MRMPTTMNWMKSCELMESKRRVFIARMNRMCSCVEYDAPHLLPAAAFWAFLTCRRQASSVIVLRRSAGVSICSKHIQSSPPLLATPNPTLYSCVEGCMQSTN